MNTLEKINILKNKAIDEIKNANSEEDLKSIELFYFNRKNGEIINILKSISKLSNEEKKIVGKESNITKNIIEKFIADKYFELEEEKNNNLHITEEIDITEPSINKRVKETGKRHPISCFISDTEKVFSKFGFEVAEGYEIEDDFHNFEALNFTPDHPAREMQDTFFIKNEELKGYVLRTQTSDMQIRFMESNKPPFRIIAPGKVFRKDSDATHSPMFHQIECLMIDKNISLANLRFILLSALKELIDPKVELRFRLSYFPFTEPSLEVDALLKVDGERKWLEIGGAGMVHPNVLKNVGVDSKEFNGFAFGFGVERMIMIKYGINDLRLFFKNDLRFLKQF
jgi:phenylalanyl-tRNA synthetase alpha chain